MDDLRFAATVRRLRIRLGLRQVDLAARCAVSASTISRIERGHLDGIPLGTLRRVAAVLEIRLDLVPRWRGGDLDRMLSARHSALHELVARDLRRRPGWLFQPEVSFNLQGERGIIDILAFHPVRRMLIVVELKTEIVDVNELVGTLDRKVRLASRIARERGWDLEPGVSICAWVIVSDTRTNRRRVQAHASMLRAVFPHDGRSVRRLLDDAGSAAPFRCLSFWPDSHPRNVGRGSVAVRRVRRRDPAPSRARLSGRPEATAGRSP